MIGWPSFKVLSLVLNGRSRGKAALAFVSVHMAVHMHFTPWVFSVVSKKVQLSPVEKCRCRVCVWVGELVRYVFEHEALVVSMLVNVLLVFV